MQDDYVGRAFGAVRSVVAAAADPCANGGRGRGRGPSLGVEVEPMPVVTTALLDTRGLLCPGPLMETIRAMREVEAGQLLVVLSDDPGTRTDLALWTEQSGHELVSVAAQGSWDEITIRRLH